MYFVELLNISVENFLSLETMNLDLQNRGLVLLEGSNLDSNGFESNGSGKSSILESITYALYGKLSNSTAGDNIINRQAGKGTSVVLSFNIDNTSYRIERYRKHKEFKNKVLLFINGEERTQASIKETNAMIQEIIGIDISTYLNSIIFGQGDIKKFSQSTDKEKKALLEDIANITIYKKAQDKAKEHRDATKQQLYLLTSTVNTNNIIYQNILQNKESADKAYNEGLAYKETLKTRVNDLKTRVKEAKKSLPTQAQTLAWHNKLLTVQAEINSLTSPEMTINPIELSTLDTEITNDTLNISKYSNEIEEAKASVHNLLNIPNAICQYCGSLLDETHKQQEVNRLLEKATTAQTKGIQIQNQLPSKQNKSAELHKQYEEDMQKQANVQQRMNSLYQEKQALDSKVGSVTVISNNISALEEQLEEAQQMYSNYKSVKPKSVDKELQEAKNAVELSQVENTEVTKKLEEFTKVVEVYSNKGVRSHIMDLVTPYLTQQANKYLSILTDGTLSVIIGVNEETDSLDLRVNNINGANDYELNSKGEKKRIDLAISLAMQDYVMSRSNIKPSFIGYDEVFDGLDGVGIERIMTVLKERIKDIPSIFVISHNSNLKELFENTITVEKKGGMAHVITH